MRNVVVVMVSGVQIGFVLAILSPPLNGILEGSVAAVWVAVWVYVDMVGAFLSCIF